jgi:hypothetical protein
MPGNGNGDGCVSTGAWGCLDIKGPYKHIDGAIEGHPSTLWRSHESKRRRRGSGAGVEAVQNRKPGRWAKRHRFGGERMR